MNNSSSFSYAPTSSSKLSHTHNKNKNSVGDTIAINEKINRHLDLLLVIAIPAFTNKDKR